MAVNWQWMVDAKLISGDPTYYSKGLADPGEYANAVKVAYSNSKAGSPERKQLIDMLWTTGAFSGSKEYWYQDRSSEVGSLANAAKGLTGAGDESGQKLLSVGGKPQVWKVGDEVYLVHETVGADGEPIRLAWLATSMDDVQSFFGPGQSITYNQTMVALPNDVLMFGSTDELANMTDDPITTWSNTLATESKTQPWLLDPDYQALSLMAVLEGRPLSDSEIQQTNWWQSNTASQRSWMKLYNSDPMSAQQRIDESKIQVRQMLQASGVSNATDEMINYMSDEWAMGNWTQAYLSTQVRAVSDPASGIPVSSGLQNEIGTSAIDTTRAAEGDVRDLVKRWLGPNFGQWNDETIAGWAGRVRNDPDAMLALEEQLKDQKTAMFQGYDRESDYNTIASPWRNFMSNMWGETVDESDTLFQQVINMNDSVEAGKLLTQEGLARGNQKVSSEIASKMQNAFRSV